MNHNLDKKYLWQTCARLSLCLISLAFPKLGRGQIAPTVIELSSGVRPTELADAKAGFANGAVLKMHDADPSRFGGLFNIGVPILVHSAEPTAARYCILAAHRNEDGTVHTFEGQPVTSGVNDRTGCESQFKEWLSTEFSAPRDLPTPSPLSWTPLLTHSYSGNDFSRGSFTENIAVYRAASIDRNFDYYMAVKDASVKPNFQSCNLSAGCYWFNLSQDLTLATDPNYNLFDHGPGNVPMSGSAGFTIGLSLSGPDVAYSRSWNQLDVTTTDYTANNFQNTHLDFTGWNGFTNPPATSTSLFSSSQGAIFQIPAGVSDFNLLVQDTAWVRGWGEIPGDQFPGNHDEKNAINISLRVNAPVFAAYPSIVTGMPKDQGIINLQAYIPASSQGLPWKVASKPDWLSLSTNSGSGSARLTYNVSPSAPIGAVDYITLDTDPSYAAPSVRSGPLSIRCEVATARAHSGVLLAGGAPWTGDPRATAEIWNPITGSTILTAGFMSQARQWHSATALPNGKILLAGGLDSSLNSSSTSDLFDPDTTLFTPGPAMIRARSNHTATLLQNGQVLVAGGIDASGKPLNVAEIYDPGANTFSRTAGDMVVGRQQHTATLLNDGRVLITGGTGAYTDSIGFTDAELYNPATKTFSRTGDLKTGRLGQTATLLSNGQVLIIGGTNFYGNSIGTAELYTVANGTFTLTGGLQTGRKFAASLLAPSDNTVLLIGGLNYANSVSIYSPDSASFSFAANFMTEDRDNPTAVLISGTYTGLDDKVLVAGGVIQNTGNSQGTRIEIYDPVHETWSLSGKMINARTGLTSTSFGSGAGMAAATSAP